MKITIISNIDDKGKTYWTASFDETPEVVGGGDTPEEALKEGLENLENFKDYSRVEKSMDAILELLKKIDENGKE